MVRVIIVFVILMSFLASTACVDGRSRKANLQLFESVTGKNFRTLVPMYVVGDKLTEELWYVEPELSADSYQKNLLDRWRSGDGPPTGGSAWVYGEVPAGAAFQISTIDRVSNPSVDRRRLVVNFRDTQLGQYSGVEIKSSFMLSLGGGSEGTPPQDPANGQSSRQPAIVPIPGIVEQVSP